MSTNLENSTVAPGLAKVSFHSSPKEGQCQRIYKLLYSCAHAAYNKVMIKVFQARLQKYSNWKIPDVQAGFRKVRGTGDQIAKICCLIEKAREFQKKIDLCFTDYAKSLTVWITENTGKFLKRGAYHTTLLASLRVIYAFKESTVRTLHETTDWFKIVKWAHQGCI